MRIPVRRQREVARLHFHSIARSSRSIARELGLSPNTVVGLREKLSTSARPWSELQTLNDDEWIATLRTEDHSIAQRKPAPDWTDVQKRHRIDGEPLHEIWLEWRKFQPDGIAYSRFTESYAVFERRLKLVLRLARKPGDRGHVDYAGDTLRIQESEDAAPRPAVVFVGALSYSSLIFVDFSWTKSAEDWAESHVRMFEFWGGSTPWMVSDNLKAAVIRRQEGEIIVNQTYRSCLQHYSSAAAPIQPRRPKHNGSAEVAVRIVQTLVLPKLRRMRIISLAQAREEALKILEQINKRKFKGTAESRWDRFVNVERAKLIPLPAAPYVPARYAYDVLVGADYFLHWEKAYYMVPYQYANQRMDLKVTAASVTISFKNRCVAVHARLTTPGARSECPEFLPPQHKAYLQGLPEEVVLWSKRVGPATEAFVHWHLVESRDRTNGQRAVAKLRALSEEYGDERIEQVCAYAAVRRIRSVSQVKSILKTRIDRRKRDAPDSKPIDTHDNVRPGDYYGDPEENE